jgi:hypothetical protein
MQSKSVAIVTGARQGIGLLPRYSATIEAFALPHHRGLKRKKVGGTSCPVGALVLSERSAFADRQQRVQCHAMPPQRLTNGDCIAHSCAARTRGPRLPHQIWNS